MNNIAVIGTGYVGLVSGACFSEFGRRVVCMDVDGQKIENLKNGILPIYEQGLSDIVQKNVRSGRLSFTTDYKFAVESAEVIFIAVGTPPREDGSADLQYVLSAARSIAENMNGYKVIVDKSTVPIGTGQKVKQVISETLKERGESGEYDFDVVSNPEFLREGSALGDFLRPDRIVIGSESERAAGIMREVYRALYINNHPFVFTNIETAEMIKYASNAFLATKITFVNEIANLCEAVGADVKHVSKAVGLDKRVGRYFLHAGAGYGGSCFPKDTSALVSIGDDCGVNMSVVRSVIKANDAQKLRMVDKIIGGMGDVCGRTIAILGLAFKPETDDMREAPALTLISELNKRGAKLKVYDPVAMGFARKHYFDDIDELSYAGDEYDAMEGADAAVLVTEWNQFRTLDFARMGRIMRGNYFFDLRNVYEPAHVESKGFKYFGVGR